MAEAVVSFVVERLGDFTIREAKFLYGVSDQVRIAQTELQIMRGFLQDADVRQRDDKPVRLWVAEIRDAAYDLEDVIDIFAFKVAYKRQGGAFKYALRRFACLVNEGVSLHKVGSEIGSVTARITNLGQRMQTYNIGEIRGTGDALQLSQRQQQVRRAYSHIGTPDVVGLEDDVNKLVMQLVKEENCHRVVSIWDMGGLGKTTLAKQVYHHKKVRSHFDSFAWMCISQRCNAREVWVGILHKLISPTNEQRQEIAQMTNDEIAKKLFLVQKEGRCLVVFDDIWSIETWESLKAAFPVNEESKSKILLTTRNREVALHSDENGFLHEPRPLSKNESWELFEKITNIGRDQMDPEICSKLKELGKEMLQHFAGLPLAVTVLAGILKRKDSIDEWEAVSKNVKGFLRRGKGREQDYSSVSRVLELSYDDLPYQLKSCFLFLGNFPEDSKINVKELTRLWIAEGFISSENQSQSSAETMEDVAYNWLTELVERCVVQVGERGSIRKIKSCCLHDLVRDMCLLKAEDESFLRVITLNNNEATHPSSSKTKPVGRVRRLAIHVADMNVYKSVSKDEIDDRIRSLLYFIPPSINWQHWGPNTKSVFKDFRLLRVLKLEYMTIEVELPSSIGKMVHLRYLSLRHSNVTWLPSSLANLTCLQTLNLDVGGLLYVYIKCPNMVGEMKQLRHLYFPLDHSFGKQKLSCLGNLQTLQISSDKFEWSDLPQLTNLRKLSIEVVGPLKNMEETLKSTSSTLNRIRSLRVTKKGNVDGYSAEVTKIVSSCRHIYKLSVDNSILKLPQDPHHYPNLTKLTLHGCPFKDDQMAIIEKLPNLRVYFYIYDFRGEQKDTCLFQRRLSSS